MHKDKRYTYIKQQFIWGIKIVRFLHIADLHIGKRVNEFNMLKDQKHILNEILKLAENEKVDAALIAGDVYDKSQPSAEAVQLFDEFLTKLTERVKYIFIISGNHDSAQRLDFGSKIMQKNGVYIAGSFNGALQKFTLEDSFGKINVYMLPFVKPATVRPFFEEEIETYDDAVRIIISNQIIDKSERNIMIAHQFISFASQKAERSESEVISIGSLDNIDVSVFDDFDYVALGHLHGPQKVGRDTVRYSGSPLKYSFSEVHHKKSVVIIEFEEKGKLEFNLIPINPLRNLREIKGPIEELLKVGKLEKEFAQDYIHATITNEEEIYDPIGKLRKVYPNIMLMDFENSKNKKSEIEINFADIESVHKNPVELFEDFYAMQNNKNLTEVQKEVIEKIFENAGGKIT